MNQNLINLLISFFDEKLSVIAQSTPTTSKSQSRVILTKDQKKSSTRVLSPFERIKLTKPSQQYLAKLRRTGLIQSDLIDAAIMQMMMLNQPFISVDDTKKTLKNILLQQVPERETLVNFILLEKSEEISVH